MCFYCVYVFVGTVGYFNTSVRKCCSLYHSTFVRTIPKYLAYLPRVFQIFNIAIAATFSNRVSLTIDTLI